MAKKVRSKSPKLTDVHKYYIEGHADVPSEELAWTLKVSTKLVEAYKKVVQGKKNRGKSARQKELREATQPVKSEIENAGFQTQKHGKESVVVATPVSSQIGDESGKSYNIIKKTRPYIRRVKE